MGVVGWGARDILRESSLAGFGENPKWRGKLWGLCVHTIIIFCPPSHLSPHNPTTHPFSVSPPPTHLNAFPDTSKRLGDDQDSPHWLFPPPPFINYLGLEPIFRLGSRIGSHCIHSGVVLIRHDSIWQHQSIYSRLVLTDPMQLNDSSDSSHFLMNGERRSTGIPPTPSYGLRSEQR